MLHSILAAAVESGQAEQSGQTAEMQTGVAVLIGALTLLCCMAAIFFLFRGVKKERNRYASEKLKVGEFDKTSFDELLARLFRAPSKNTHFSVMYFEIHDATGIKETYGEKQYEAIISTLTERLYGVLPESTKICVYQSDLLAAIIEENLDKKALSDLSEFCLTECHKPIRLITRINVETDINIGATSYNAFSANFDQFRANLELSLAAAKRSGLNRYVIYSSEMMDSESQEYKYYQEIKSAIEAKEFTLYYQPIYDLSTRKVFAYESLLRWNHRTLGVLAPNKFLHIMEQSGDINWVGVWAFEQLLGTLQRHKNLHPDESVILTLNLSPKQLMNPSLTDEFRRVLKKYKVSADEICLEIVEFAMFDKMPVVAENIEKLTQCGFKIAIDDFGVEMSSLKLLETLRADWVKLDRSFIEQSKDDFLIGGIVDTLVEYAEQNGIKMIAEGVEDDVTLDYVNERKIPYGQGYYFGKPKPPADYNL